MNLTEGLKIGSVVLTIGIAIIPLWYPRYSCFRRNARRGIQQLQRLEQSDSIDELLIGEVDLVSEKDCNQFTQKIGELSPSVAGFHEIAYTIRREHNLPRRPVKIILAHENEGGGTLNHGDDIRSGNQAALFVEYQSGNLEMVTRPPRFEPERVLNLLDLKRQTAKQAERRSHYWTTVLAVLWGAVNILIIY